MSHKYFAPKSEGLTEIFVKKAEFRSAINSLPAPEILLHATQAFSSADTAIDDRTFMWSYDFVKAMTHDGRALRIPRK